jgi:hypothetical protein
MPPAAIIEALNLFQALLDAQNRAPEGFKHMISLKAAAHVACITNSQMRRRCQQNISGLSGGGYGFKQIGDDDWSVVTLPFLASVPLEKILRFKEVRKSQVIWATT